MSQEGNARNRIFKRRCDLITCIHHFRRGYGYCDASDEKFKGCPYAIMRCEYRRLFRWQNGIRDIANNPDDYEDILKALRNAVNHLSDSEKGASD